MPTATDRVAAATDPFAQVLARLQADADTLFGGTVRRIERGREVAGQAARVLPVRVCTPSADVDLFVKCFVGGRETRDDRKRLSRYFDWETERTHQAAVAFRTSPTLGVSCIVASYPDLLALVSKRSAGIGLDAVLRRLALARSSQSVDGAVAALSRAGAWVRWFQRGVPVRDPTFRKDYREYLDIRLRALAASGRGGFTETHRGTLLAAFETLAAQVPAADLELVAIHNDFCPANVLVRACGITVLDLAMSSDGNRFVDLAHLAFHVRLLARRWRLGPALVDGLERALLAGYDAHLRTDTPALQLMMLQHRVCHLADCAARSTGWVADQRLRRRVEWIMSL